MGGMAIAGLGGLASAGASFLGSSKQASAAGQSAQMQGLLGMQALAQQQAQYAQTRADFQPYRDAGASAVNKLTGSLDYLTSPIKMDQATLEQTPGYQFNLSQGLKATQNSAAARGLGVSGAALKGAATYATGLADSTYQNQFSNENTNRTNAFNRLYQTSSMGETAAAQQGMLGQANTNQQTNLLTGMGNTYGAATMAQANAGYNALTGFANAFNSTGQLYGASSMYANNRNNTSGSGGGLFGGLTDAAWNAYLPNSNGTVTGY